MIDIRESESYTIDSDPLAALLSAAAPRAPEDSPPVFAFTRKREVDIPWSDMVAGEPPGSVQAMRAMFETSWGLVDPTQPALSALIAMPEEGKTHQMIGDLNPEQPEPSYRAQPAYRTKFAPAGEAPAADVVSQGIVLRDAISGRRFVLHPVAGETLTIKDFITPDAYRAAWNKVDVFELVFDSEAEAKTCFTDFEELDMRPAYIERRFRELDIMHEMVSALEAAVPAQSATEIKTLLESGADAAEVESLYQRFLRMRMNKFDVDRAIEKLVSFTADLGYFLYREDQKRADKTVIAPRGRVCTKVERTIRWQTVQTRPEIRWHRGFLGIPYRAAVRVRYTQQHTKVIEEPQPIDTSSNLLAKWQDAYRIAQPDAEIYVFDRSGQGFATADGVLLRTVVDRCRLDEQFRRRCVVVLPIYERSLRGRRILLKYHIFKRPMPAVIPSTLPRLTLVESLSYRTAWRGTEVGELVSSVNLAPGEQRTIRLFKSYEQETIVSKSTSSMFELEDKSTTDLSSEMESEFNSEQTESTNASLSTSISGENMFVTGSASATAGVSTSGREFAKTINKIAKRASKSVSSKNRQEVSTSSTSKTTISTRDESEATVRNSNEGRTLNLMFHRLYNRYEGGLYLDDLAFEVIPSVELIEGSGVYDALSFGLHDFNKVVDHLAATPLPFEVTPTAKRNIGVTVLGSVEDVITNDYSEAAGDEPDDQLETSMGVLHFPQPAEKLMLATAAGRQAAIDGLESRLRRAAVSLKSNKPIEPIALVVASSGLYLDAMVGRRPSTEPYSEKMRALETRMREAEVFASQAAGMVDRARALRIARMVGSQGDLSMTSIDFDRTQLRSIKLGLNGPLPEGNWQLLLDHSAVPGKLFHDDEGVVTVTFDEPQSWLKRDDLLFSIALTNEELGLTIDFTRLSLSASR